MKLLANSQQAQFLKELDCVLLGVVSSGGGGGHGGAFVVVVGDAEGPAAAAEVARVFPKGLDGGVEEMAGGAEGQGGEVEVVEEGPEGADVGDGVQDGEVGSVVCGVLVRLGCVSEVLEVTRWGCRRGGFVDGWGR